MGSCQVGTSLEWRSSSLNIRDLKILIFSSSETPSQPDAYRDGSNGSLWNSWGVSGGAAALLRPDGHVGWMGRRPFPVELESGVRRALGC